MLLMVSAPIVLSLPATPAQATNKTTDRVFPQVRNDKALVYLIRQKRYRSHGVEVYLFADDEMLAVLSNNSYAYAYITPGKHLLWINWRKIHKEIEFIPGKTYYFDVWYHIKVISGAQGEALINDSIKYYVTPKKGEKKKAEKYIKKYYKALAGNK